LTHRLQCWAAPFQAEAQAAAAQAAAAAAVRANEAVKNIKEIIRDQPPKIKLDIDLSAPILFVPKKSDSDECLIIDLGSS
jgi:putative N-acetylmannosamine-6-phosphate epimerase